MSVEAGAMLVLVLVISCFAPKLGGTSSQNCFCDNTQPSLAFLSVLMFFAHGTKAVVDKIVRTLACIKAPACQ